MMSRKWLMWAGCGVMVLAGGYWLWTKGYQNILGYGALLLCPLMHLFMHGSHDHAGHNHAQAAGEQSTSGADSGGKEKPACH
jgi:hypothetical protein